MKPQDLLLAATFVGGLAAFAIGAALIYLPAGLMVGGATAVTAAVLYARGRGE